jgi:hypothetical protein
MKRLTKKDIKVKSCKPSKALYAGGGYQIFFITNINNKPATPKSGGSLYADKVFNSITGKYAFFYEEEEYDGLKAIKEAIKQDIINNNAKFLYFSKD